MKAELKKTPKQQKSASVNRDKNHATTGFMDNRQSTALQLQLMEGITSSPQAVAQQQLNKTLTHTIQKAEDEELLQGKFVTTQRVKPEEEELLQGKLKTVQRAEPEEEELLQGKFDKTAQRRPLEEEEEPLQGKFSAGANAVQLQEETPPVNKTGMPDQLKAGIESLSGMNISDVRVHKNSSKPAQLNALAYAQGNDIHLGSGQEQHLPLEAWHVVQQRQGRVKPTMQMAGEMVNDDVGLEKEADVMGGRAAVQRLSKVGESKPAYSNENRSLSAIIPIQQKAGVESFSVNWKKHPSNNEKNAAFWIDYKAKFKHGDGFDAGDAEFRQNASDDWKIEEEDGNTITGKSPLQDDSYNKAADPEMYTGDNKENFKGVDQPGWSDNELNSGDKVTWSFTAEQMVVDTSDSDKILEKKGPKTVKITGKHPRNHNLNP